MVKIETIGQYKVKSGDCFFFDNNVWMLLFSPVAGARAKEQRIYASLLQQIQSARATIFINSLVLSEYINRSLRLSFDHWRNTQPPRAFRLDYKRDYRPTPDFKEAQDAIYAEVEDILNAALRKPDDFNALDLSALRQAQCSDFNDAYYANFCKLNNLILVSDDRDFQTTTLDITLLTV